MLTPSTMQVQGGVYKVFITKQYITFVDIVCRLCTSHWCHGMCFGSTWVGSWKTETWREGQSGCGCGAGCTSRIQCSKRLVYHWTVKQRLWTWAEDGRSDQLEAVTDCFLNNLFWYMKLMLNCHSIYTTEATCNKLKIHNYFIKTWAV